MQSRTLIGMDRLRQDLPPVKVSIPGFPCAAPAIFPDPGHEGAVIYIYFLDFGVLRSGHGPLSIELFRDCFGELYFTVALPFFKMSAHFFRSR